MHRLILWQVFIIYFLFISPVNTFASDIVINEIFANPEDEKDEFIELYNNSEEEVDLNDWKISDLVETYTISDSEISGKGYLVLNKSVTDIRLNNSNEEVSLTDKDNNEIDSFSYDDTIEGKSWSRVPDGTGGFEDNTDVTKGSENSSPPTPTPTKTPTPTSTPKPTKSPTSTSVPIATSIVTQKDSLSSPGSHEDIESIEVVRGVSKTINKDKNKEGLSDEEGDIDENLENDSPPDYLYSITTGAGMIILACGILLYRRFKNRNEEDDF